MTGRAAANRSPVRITFVLAAFVGVLAHAGPAEAQARVGFDEYLDRLERAIELAQSTAPGDAGPAQMRAIEETIGLPLVVDGPDGEVPLPSDPVFRTLTGNEAGDFPAVAEHLRAVLAEARAVTAHEPRDAEEIREALGAASAEVRGDEGLLQRLRRRAAEFLADLLFRLFRYEGLGTIGAWVMLGAVLAGIVWLVRRLGLGIVPERRTAPAGRARLGAVDWRRLADEAAARGDLAAAVRYRYHALLAELAAAGWLRDDPSLTAGEARAAIGRGRPQLYPAVARATTAFERVAYGRSEPAADDLEAIRAAEEAARR